MLWYFSKLGDTLAILVYPAVLLCKIKPYYSAGFGPDAASLTPS
jgi:hypothetical protein